MKLTKYWAGLFFIAFLNAPLWAIAPTISIQDIYKLQDEKKLKQVVFEYEPIAQQKNEVFYLKLVGVAYHNLGVSGGGGAPEKAMIFLQKAYDLSPTDNETLAFLGSSITMVARDSCNFFTKLSDVNRGINLLDKAVAKDPSNCVIRIVRGNNAQHLPDFLGRKNIAKQDFLKIDDVLVKDSTQLDRETSSEIYYKLGLIYKEEKDLGNAKKYFEKSENLAPTSSSGQLSKKELYPLHD